ncbi:MAG: 1-acyl-sn-glycerol-3-phosphate acyltransferase [Bacteroidales bacterium]|nr:1-acyl-sn-glycerol-3-phosphate acyltransferase [Bacteroidales bacterium]
MRKFWTYLYSVWFWIELFGTSAILFPAALLIWIVTMPFDSRRYYLHQFSCTWSNLAFWLNPLWRLNVSGKEKIDKKGTYVIVSNHQSGADILVLFTLRLHFKWVAKRSLFFVPFLGWNMAMNRYIALRRGKKSSMHKMMERAKRDLLKGNSMMIFPEGTRSRDGNLQPFKSGAFHLALDTHIPILPIVISGTSEAIRKGGYLISKQHNLRVRILDPIPYEDYKGMEPKELAEVVHQKIEKELTVSTP